MAGALMQIDYVSCCLCVSVNNIAFMFDISSVSYWMSEHGKRSAGREMQIIKIIRFCLHRNGFHEPSACTEAKGDVALPSHP